ncbi:MAG TPA: response regulator transcription factor [Trebonia sp.]
MIRTLVAGRVALIRAGLLALLARQPDMEVVAELDRAELVVPAAGTSQPDVAVIAEGVAGQGFATIRALRAAVPSCGSVIVASGHSPGKLREAVAASADGFVLMESAPEKIAEAVRRVAAGGKALDPDLVFSALNTAASPLTAREMDVLRLAAQGAPATEIADELYLSVGTVRNYMSRVIGKTGARSRVDAIRIAEGAGWL